MVKVTPQLVQSVHSLAAQGLSGRAIAARLDCSEATVRRALKRDPTPAPRPAAPARRPTLLSQPINPASPCPDSAPPWCRRLYASLVQRDLLSELDALLVFADLDVPRCPLTLDLSSTDVLVRRIASLQERVDLDNWIARLK